MKKIRMFLLCHITLIIFILSTYLKVFVQQSLLSHREFLIWKERGRGREGGWVGQVRFERNRGERQQYREIERHRNK
jgi:hypothetical protein